MKKLLIGVLAGLALILGAAIPAQAASSGATELPPTVSGYKFWTGSVCMAVGDTTINAPYLAQVWNNQSSGEIAIQASNNCVTAGYTPSTRFTIDTYSAADGTCGTIKNPDGTTNLDASYYNGMWRYTNNPVTWVNTYYSTCTSHLSHFVSQAIGHVMGLQLLNSTGYNSRVMNNTDWSRANVGSASAPEGTRIAELYQGVYGG